MVEIDDKSLKFLLIGATVILIVGGIGILGIVVSEGLDDKKGASDASDDTNQYVPTTMTITLHNKCENTIRVRVWVDNKLKCDDYIGTGLLRNLGWVTPSVSNSKISVQFCIAEYSLWSKVYTVPGTYNNGDNLSLYFYPDLGLKYDKW